MTYTIQEWRPDSPYLDAEITMLSEILREVVYGGAGVSFFVPFSLDDARAFWTRNVLPAMRDGTRRVLVARLSDTIVGTVQLNTATPPNQRHRADVAKMMVHPSARRCGIARALMIAVEEVARAEGRTLLTLDTVSGSPAEILYRSLGYVVVGIIPGYARKALSPDLEPTTVMYKNLSLPPWSDR
jgi:ribosomal protein S18 acetylase RimI-like enzyme